MCRICIVQIQPRKKMSYELVDKSRGFLPGNMNAPDQNRSGTYLPWRNEIMEVGKIDDLPQKGVYTFYTYCCCALTVCRLLVRTRSLISFFGRHHLWVPWGIKPSWDRPGINTYVVQGKYDDINRQQRSRRMLGSYRFLYLVACLLAGCLLDEEGRENHHHPGRR